MNELEFGVKKVQAYASRTPTHRAKQKSCDIVMDSLDFEDIADFLVGGASDDPLVDFTKKYRIAPEKARVLLKDVIHLCAVARDKRTGQMYKGFATAEGWLAKTPVVFNRVEG